MSNNTRTWTLGANKLDDLRIELGLRRSELGEYLGILGSVRRVANWADGHAVPPLGARQLLEERTEGRVRVGDWHLPGEVRSTRTHEIRKTPVRGQHTKVPFEPVRPVGPPSYTDEVMPDARVVRPSWLASQPPLVSPIVQERAGCRPRTSWDLAEIRSRLPVPDWDQVVAADEAPGPLLKKAELCVKVAQWMLPTSSDEVVETQALSFMALSDLDLINMWRLLQGDVIDA